MSKRLPALIEPLRLAEKSSLLEGQLPLSQMKRITPLLFVGKGVEDKGELAISLQFDIDESRQANIQGRINGEITLVCQRCMQGMTYKIDSTVSLAIVRNEAQAVKLPSHYEPLILDEESKVSLAELIEDELLLALPAVAVHDIKDCPAGDRFLPKQEDTKKAENERGSGTEKPNPFAVLEQLKKKTGDR